MVENPSGNSALSDYGQHPSGTIVVTPVRMKVVRLALGAEAGNIDLFRRHSGLDQLQAIDFREIQMGGMGGITQGLIILTELESHFGAHLIATFADSWSDHNV